MGQADRGGVGGELRGYGGVVKIECRTDATANLSVRRGHYLCLCTGMMKIRFELVHTEDHDSWSVQMLSRNCRKLNNNNNNNNNNSNSRPVDSHKCHVERGHSALSHCILSTSHVLHPSEVCRPDEVTWSELMRPSRSGTLRWKVSSMLVYAIRATISLYRKGWCRTVSD